MSVPLVFHPAVQGEVDEAYRWYERQRSGLGEDFLAAIEEVFERIRQSPGIHQAVYRDVRRGLPKRFPYGVYYRVHADRVEVIAVYHSRRDPSGWQARA
jgi:plasmid stabilization system protein ParE